MTIDYVWLPTAMTQAGGRAELAFVEPLFSIRTNQTRYPRHCGRGFSADLDSGIAWRYRAISLRRAG